MAVGLGWMTTDLAALTARLGCTILGWTVLAEMMADMAFWLSAKAWIASLVSFILFPMALETIDLKISFDALD